MDDWSDLKAAAARAHDRAYAPYSGFSVGAALECEDGTIVEGANVENASFGLTICAERSAISAAVVGGLRSFSRIVIHTTADGPVAPCGACRQVLAEFAPELRVLSVWSGGEEHWSLSELQPHPFRFDVQRRDSD
jgi:cytidine deaminase